MPPELASWQRKALYNDQTHNLASGPPGPLLQVAPSCPLVLVSQCGKGGRQGQNGAGRGGMGWWWGSVSPIGNAAADILLGFNPLSQMHLNLHHWNCRSRYE